MHESLLEKVRLALPNQLHGGFCRLCVCFRVKDSALRNTVPQFFTDPQNIIFSARQNVPQDTFLRCPENCLQGVGVMCAGYGHRLRCGGSHLLPESLKVFQHTALLLVHRVPASPVSPQIQFPELLRYRFRDNRFPINVIHIQSLDHAAEQDNIHALGAA